MPCPPLCEQDRKGINQMSAVSDFMNLELTVKDFGTLVGISERTVRRLIKTGKIPAKSQNPLRIKVDDGLSAFMNHLKENAKSEDRPVDDEKARSEKLRADADISIYKAKQEEAKWKEMEGQLHRSEDVQAMTEDLIYTIRGAIIALPGKLAMNVAAEDDPNVCSKIIKEEVILVLEGLSNYEYSKERYLARMKEREGHEEAVEEEDF